MKLSKSDIRFSLKGLVFFSLIFLGLFNPEELIANIKIYSLEQVGLAQLIKENIDMALTFKKIFLK